MPLIDLEKVYESACAGCTRHGDAPGECYHDEPCERLIFAFTTAEPVDAVEVIRCKDCVWRQQDDINRNFCGLGDFYCGETDYCSRGERNDKQ